MMVVNCSDFTWTEKLHMEFTLQFLVYLEHLLETMWYLKNPPMVSVHAHTCAAIHS